MTRISNLWWLNKNVSKEQGVIITDVKEFYDAITSKNLFRVKSFVEQWDINKPTGRHSTLLTAACCKEGITSNEIIKILLEKGANPNVLDKDRDTPLLLAINRQNIEIVKLLIKHGANVNLEGHVTPIMYILSQLSFKDRDNGILSYESQEMIDAILPLCDPNQICRRGYSPLIYAANFEDMNTFFKLIEMGADYSYIYRNGDYDFWHYTNDRNQRKIKDRKDELIAKNKIFEGFYNYLYDKGYLMRPKPKEDEKKISNNQLTLGSEFASKLLEENEKIEFTLKGQNFQYTIQPSFISINAHRMNNDHIFKILDLDKFKICKKAFGYEPKYEYEVGSSYCPECKEGDYKALTKLVNILKNECLKQSKNVVAE
jgi:hypothetical protein